MTDNDIYNSKEKYEKFKNNLQLFTLRPEERKPDRGKKLKYYCKNSKNLQYFDKLFTYFEAKDLSYIRRNRSIDIMKLKRLKHSKTCKFHLYRNLDTYIINRKLYKLAVHIYKL